MTLEEKQREMHTEQASLYARYLDGEVMSKKEMTLINKGELELGLISLAYAIPEAGFEYTTGKLMGKVIKGLNKSNYSSSEIVEAISGGFVKQLKEAGKDLLEEGVTESLTLIAQKAVDYYLLGDYNAYDNIMAEWVEVLASTAFTTLPLSAVRGVSGSRHQKAYISSVIAPKLFLDNESLNSLNEIENKIADKSVSKEEKAILGVERAKYLDKLVESKAKYLSLSNNNRKEVVKLYLEEHNLNESLKKEGLTDVTKNILNKNIEGIRNKYTAILEEDTRTQKVDKYKKVLNKEIEHYTKVLKEDKYSEGAKQEAKDFFENPKKFYENRIKDIEESNDGIDFIYDKDWRGSRNLLRDIQVEESKAEFTDKDKKLFKAMPMFEYFTSAVKGDNFFNDKKRFFEDPKKYLEEEIKNQFNDL